MAKHKEAMEELEAIRDLAVEEKAEKTKARLEKLIGKNEKEHQEILKKTKFKDHWEAFEGYRRNR